jgi:acyl dehydratase
MLPLRHETPTGHHDDLDQIGAADPQVDAAASVAGWDLTAWTESVSPEPAPASGTVLEVVGGDVVTSAPELARLTLNIAAVHHDEQAAGGRRLVYGGHAIGLALAQAARALPDLLTVLAWRSCDHTGPVGEGDTLRSRITVERVSPGAAGGHVVDLRSVVTADDSRPVLDWRFSALFA